MANTNGTATTTLTVSMAELLKGRLLDRSSFPSVLPATPEGNRQEAIRPPGETQDTKTEIASNMATTQTNKTKKTNKKAQAKKAEKPVETVAAPHGSGASRAIVSSILGELLQATKAEVATKSPNATPEQQARQVATKMERRVITVDSTNERGADELLLVAPFSGGFLKVAKDEGLTREFVKDRGATFVPAGEKKKLLKVLRNTWSFGGSVLVMDGKAEVLPRHDEAVANFKASQAAK